MISLTISMVKEAIRLELTPRFETFTFIFACYAVSLHIQIIRLARLSRAASCKRSEASTPVFTQGNPTTSLSE